MKYEIGDRVKSNKVPENSYDNFFQDKQLEIVEFLKNGKVRCKFFLEKEIRPKIEYFEVSEESLTFISKEPLKYQGIEKDKFLIDTLKNYNSMTWSRKKTIVVSGKQQGTIIYRQVGNGFNAEINLTNNVIGRKIMTKTQTEDDFELKIVIKKFTAQSTDELDKLINDYLETCFKGDILLEPKLA